MAKELKREFGLEPTVGFAIENDVLVRVEVMFPVEVIGTRRASSLHRKARAAVERHFGRLPRRLVVSTVSTH